MNYYIVIMIVLLPEGQDHERTFTALRDWIFGRYRPGQTFS
jgi:hypothetical protein